MVIGSGGRSAIATSVERETRLTLLIKVPSRKPRDVVACVAPRLRRACVVIKSVTWDQGKELHRPRRARSTDRRVEVCGDAHSPWQRGSNENAQLRNKTLATKRAQPERASSSAANHSTTTQRPTNDCTIRSKSAGGLRCRDQHAIGTICCTPRCWDGVTIQEAEPVKSTIVDLEATSKDALDSTDGSDTPVHSSRLVGFGLDVSAIFLLPLVAIAAFGVNQWVQPYSPDSDFYFGLSNFGSAVFERLSDPAYYWTRIGLIGPLHSLIAGLGTDAGYLVWRCLLLILTALPVYLIVKPVLGRLAAASAVLIALTNTVILVTVADVYPSSAAIAGFALLAGFGCLAVTSETRRGQLAAACVAGFAAGWLPAIQIGTAVNVLAAGAAVVVLLVFYNRRRALLSILVFALSAALTFCAFLLWARAMFPGRNWFKTNYDAITTIDWDIFHEKTLTWLWTDPNILVVVLVLLVGGYASWRSLSLRTPIRVSTVVLLFMSVASFGQQFGGGGQNLQLPYYYSQLWPPLVLVLGLVAVSFARTTPQQFLLLALCAIALPFAGKSQWVFTWWPVGIALTAICLLLVVCVGDSSKRPIGMFAASTRVVLLIGALSTVQIMQNGLGPVEGLIIGRRSPAQAFQPSQYKDYYKLAYQVESWVVANTNPGEDVVNLVQGPPAIWGGSFAAADSRVMLSFGSSGESRRSVLSLRRTNAIAYTASTIQQAKDAIRMILVGSPTVRVCQSFTQGELAAATCIADFRLL